MILRVVLLLLRSGRESYHMQISMIFPSQPTESIELKLNMLKIDVVDNTLPKLPRETMLNPEPVRPVLSETIVSRTRTTLIGGKRSSMRTKTSTRIATNAKRSNSKRTYTSTRFLVRELGRGEVWFVLSQGCRRRHFCILLRKK